MIAPERIGGVRPRLVYLALPQEESAGATVGDTVERLRRLGWQVDLYAPSGRQAGRLAAALESWRTQFRARRALAGADVMYAQGQAASRRTRVAAARHHVCCVDEAEPDLEGLVSCLPERADGLLRELAVRLPRVDAKRGTWIAAHHRLPTVE